jgi:hypothetical protein
LDSHIWFRIDPFHVDKNFVILSVSDENPAEPTKTKCCTCSGCYTYILRDISEQVLLLFFIQKKKKSIIIILEKEHQTSHFNAIYLKRIFGGNVTTKRMPKKYKFA